MKKGLHLGLVSEIPIGDLREDRLMRAAKAEKEEKIVISK